MTASLVFWSSCAALGYTLFGYPLALAACARVRRGPVLRSQATPSVSVVVVAYNEAARIAKRIENLLALDYPPACLEIIVCSDGSTDATAECARSHADPRVTVLGFEHRRGKPAVLNDAVAKAKGEIVVFADARQSFERGALRALTAAFGDPKVGAVSGELCLLSNPSVGAVAAGVGFYWRYEKLLRRLESEIDSSVGATGAIYALRRALFVPIPSSTILDDVLIPMQVVRAGYRTLFEPEARAYDYAPNVAAEEFARKVRTIAGTFQLFAFQPWLLDPRRNRVWLQTVSHKLMRLIGPLALLLALCANCFLLDSPLYRATFTAQVLLYAVAGYEHLRAGGAPQHRGVAARLLLGVPYAFCVLQAATVVGCLRFLAGRQTVTWKKASA